MTPDELPEELQLPRAAQGFQRLSAAVGTAGPAAGREQPVALRARALAASMLAGIAAGEGWDEAWSADDVPDEDLVSALLGAAAALMHWGADRTGMDPVEVLRQALPASPTSLAAQD